VADVKDYHAPSLTAAMISPEGVARSGQGNAIFVKYI
jgi:hypothetical protein